MSAEAVMQSYEAAAAGVEAMGEEVALRIAEAATAIRAGGEDAKARIAEMSAMSLHIIAAAADLKRKVGA
jgi:hypothetical protein